MQEPEFLGLVTSVGGTEGPVLLPWMQVVVTR